MPDYSKTIIYKLCCKDATIEDIYIGSTCNFARRKCQHKSTCNTENCKGYDYKLYQFIRNNGGFDNWSMIMIEEFNCNNKLEKEQRERFHIELLKPTLNKYIPTRSNKEYYEDNKNLINEKRKEYQKQYNLNNKEKQKQYFQINKDKIKKYKKEYYEKNKNNNQL